VIKRALKHASQQIAIFFQQRGLLSAQI
jgi:hypothetical protein